MDFHYTSQFEDGDDDDDVFYAELRRQILLLTADQDEDGEGFVRSRKRANSVGLSSTLQPGVGYFNWWGSAESESVPTWLVNLWRNNGNGNGNGTGVFIPHIVKTRRYNKAGRTKDERRVFRQVGS